MVKKIFVKLRIDKIERHSLDQILSSKIKIGVIVKHKAPKKHYSPSFTNHFNRYDIETKTKLSNMINE